MSERQGNAAELTQSTRRWLQVPESSKNRQELAASAPVGVHRQASTSPTYSPMQRGTADSDRRQQIDTLIDSIISFVSYIMNDFRVEFEQFKNTIQANMPPDIVESSQRIPTPIMREHHGDQRSCLHWLLNPKDARDDNYGPRLSEFKASVDESYQQEQVILDDLRKIFFGLIRQNNEQLKVHFATVSRRSTITEAIKNQQQLLECLRGLSLKIDGYLKLLQQLITESDNLTPKAAVDHTATQRLRKPIVTALGLSRDNSAPISAKTHDFPKHISLNCTPPAA